jgi:hypothetical protein
MGDEFTLDVREMGPVSCAPHWPGDALGMFTTFSRRQLTVPSQRIPRSATSPASACCRRPVFRQTGTSNNDEDGDLLVWLRD